MLRTLSSNPTVSPNSSWFTEPTLKSTISSSTRMKTTSRSRSRKAMRPSLSTLISHSYMNPNARVLIMQELMILITNSGHLMMAASEIKSASLASIRLLSVESKTQSASTVRNMKLLPVSSHVLVTRWTTSVILATLDLKVVVPVSRTKRAFFQKKFRDALQRCRPNNAKNTVITKLRKVTAKFLATFARVESILPPTATNVALQATSLAGSHSAVSLC